MRNRLYSQTLFIAFLLLTLIMGNVVNGQRLDTFGDNNTTGNDGTVAARGDHIEYTVLVTNTTTSNITNSVLTSMIPPGTMYIAGSTEVNDVPVPDVNGQMPFAAGGLINSASSSPGVLPPNGYVVVRFFAVVGANMGKSTYYSTMKTTTSAGTVTIKSNVVTTSITTDQSCNQIYQSTALVGNQGGTSTYPYRVIKLLNTTNGTAGTTLATGGIVPCYNAITGARLPAGVLTDAEAIAMDPNTHRIYFFNSTSNNPAQDLCCIDQAYPATGAPAALRFVGYPLETNTGTGYNINRMTFGSDGYGYALTANALDLIRFSVAPATNIPTITSLGALVNDANNGSNDVLAETSGDLFADGSGNIYLVPNSGKIYRINPATLIASYIGTISGLPATGTNSVAADRNGYLYIGGAYQAVYRVDLSTMNAVAISSGTTAVWWNGDFTSCIIPVVASAINVSKTYTNLNGVSSVRSGDPIEYTITISNTGNLRATDVRFSDALPANSHYIANSTTVNGVAVADNGGTMPFAVTGGVVITSAGESAGIVKPGDVITIKFRVTTDEYKTICNQSVLTGLDGTGTTIYVLSDDPSQPGTSDPTCFYSDKSPVSMQATKTYHDLDRDENLIGVVTNDHIEYTITIINTGTANSNGATFYDAIPTGARYVANSTTINGVAVADIGGVMPYSVTGGALINSAGASPGVVIPGTANQVVIKFRVISTAIEAFVCNQASVSVPTVSGNTITYSDDPSKSGSQDATCFFSNGALCPECGRIATNNPKANNSSDLQLNEGTLVKVQPNPFIKDLNVQVQLNTAEQIRVRLIDFYGRTVYTSKEKLNAGYNSLQLNLPASLASGIYVLELSAGNNRLVQKKLIKQ